jgi:ankyrin repeat protein
LLQAGADPNIISVYEGGTALYLAAGYSYVDTQAKKDARYVKLLLEYNADSSIGFVGNERNNTPEIGLTPLIRSIGCGIDKTKALVEAGADINQKTQSGDTAAIQALSVMRGARNSISTEVEVIAYAHYLIAEKKAEITDSYSIIFTNMLES